MPDEAAEGSSLAEREETHDWHKAKQREITAPQRKQGGGTGVWRSDSRERGAGKMCSDSRNEQTKGKGKTVR